MVEGELILEINTAGCATARLEQTKCANYPENHPYRASLCDLYALPATFLRPSAFFSSPTVHVRVHVWYVGRDIL